MCTKAASLTMVFLLTILAGAHVASGRPRFERIERNSEIERKSRPISATPGSDSPVTEGSVPVVLFLIDKSGSTSYDPLGGTAKLEMEKETIRRAVAAAPDGTTIGVIAFNDQQEWVVPFTTIVTETSQADRRQIVIAVDGITADGGSELPDALRAAYDAMRAERGASTKQIVLLSDGKSRSGEERVYRHVVEAGVAEGTTLFAIAFGNDADTTTMRLLAELGNGVYQLVETPEDIPTLSVRSGTLVVETPTASPVAR